LLSGIIRPGLLELSNVFAWIASRDVAGTGEDAGIAGMFAARVL
jgi:hypothetical protein